MLCRRWPITQNKNTNTFHFGVLECWCSSFKTSYCSNWRRHRFDTAILSYSMHVQYFIIFMILYDTKKCISIFLANFIDKRKKQNRMCLRSHIRTIFRLRNEKKNVTCAYVRRKRNKKAKWKVITWRKVSKTRSAVKIYSDWKLVAKIWFYPEEMRKPASTYHKCIHTNQLSKP